MIRREEAVSSSQQTPAVFVTTRPTRQSLVVVGLQEGYATMPRERAIHSSQRFPKASVFVQFGV
jgi:hypothetical protein